MGYTRSKKKPFQGNTKTFFRIIKKYQHFNLSLKSIKDTEVAIHMEPKKKAQKQREYFMELIKIYTDHWTMQERRYIRKLNLK